MSRSGEQFRLIACDGFFILAHHIALTLELEHALFPRRGVARELCMKILKAVFFIILGLTLGTGLSSF